MDATSGVKIRRKPVGSSVAVVSSRSSHEKGMPAEPPPPYSGPDLSDDFKSLGLGSENEKGVSLEADNDDGYTPPLPARPKINPLLPTYDQTPLASASDSYPPNIAISDTQVTPPATDLDNSQAQPSKSFLATALSETRHFATGLVPHPAASTRHYTILRHSPPLILYRGPTTSLVVTVFSSRDHPYPPESDRSLWLQRRGFSGDSGMRLRALVGATGTWVDVTPAARVAPGDVAARADERGWVRDIARFRRRAEKESGGKAHVARETMVVRLPGSAGDGYFRVVLCSGGGESAMAPGMGIEGAGRAATTKRKMLCASPVFRVASTKLDSSVLRGASLSSVPLELGVKIGSMVGRYTAGGYASAMASPIQAQLQKYEPGFIQRQVGQAAFSASGAGRRVEALDDVYRQRRELSFDSLESEGSGSALDGSVDEAPPEVIGADEGPKKPFPLTIQGRVVKGTGKARADPISVPTANLADVPDDIKLRLMDGVYFGWACVIPRKGLDNISHDWHESIIAKGPSAYAAPAVVMATQLTVHMLHDFGNSMFLDAKMKIIVMGYLRPPRLARNTDLTGVVSEDAVVTIASLSRENWGPEATLARIKTEKSARSFSDKVVGVRQNVQTQVDRIPFHWAGVRTPGAELRDRRHGRGGFWIPR